MSKRLEEIKERLKWGSAGYNEFEWLIDRLERLEKVREQAIAMYRGVRAEDWSIYEQEIFLKALKESEE